MTVIGGVFVYLKRRRRDYMAEELPSVKPMGPILEVGDKVTYVTPHVSEKGIIKEVVDDEYVFVVYHCGDDWANYQQYTAAKTKRTYLIRGWRYGEDRNSQHKVR